jgi:hypothetical protein
MRVVNGPTGESRRRFPDRSAGATPSRLRWLVRAFFQCVLFWLACATSAALVALVAFAPLLADESRLAPRWLVLFARDAAVRRTAVASALGLVVTASIFFRTPPGPPAKRKRDRPDTVGA